MPHTTSAKSKADEGELKPDLITEIKSVIQLEVEKVVKKQKEEFDVTVLKLQEQITTLELGKFFREACPDIPVSCID